MPEIRLLDASVINLIAAGEVVDRPASAVKELVENAIDAGAKHITVEIRRGGLGMIRVSDDGCGMSSENAKKAFLKHATSKIEKEEDLSGISTLGFRGEALAAISAVSKITLTTKEAEETCGVRFEVSEGKILSEEECGCPDGSCFTVRDLFFNTPARLKFMKSETAEGFAVQSVIERLSLSHPEISFRFILNGTERIHTPGRGDLADTVFSVLGRDFAEMTLLADSEFSGIRVYGLVGKPIFSKANRTRQIFFLNGRYVRSPILTAGLESAYHNKMLIGRVPVCVLFVEIPLSHVDVNVHPNKLEVKFSDENSVAYAIRKATETALARDSGIVEMKIEKQPEKAPEKPIQPENKASASPVIKKQPPTIRNVPVTKAIPTPSSINLEKKMEEKPFSVSQKSGWTITAPREKKVNIKSEKNRVVFQDVAHAVTKITAPQAADTPAKDSKSFSKVINSTPEATGSPEEPVLFHMKSSFRLIGEAFDCYVLIERGDEILFLDKHALHERINFERLRKSDVSSQSLLQPIVLNIGLQENRILSENADFLARFGFVLEAFGDDLLIREIPALIDPEQSEPLLQQFADSLKLRRDDTLMDRFYYDIACKASIRSGSKSTRAELEDLVSEYFRREKELQYCPHGRPVVFSLTKKSVEKQFKRVK